MITNSYSHNNKHMESAPEASPTLSNIQEQGLLEFLAKAKENPTKTTKRKKTEDDMTKNTKTSKTTDNSIPLQSKFETLSEVDDSCDTMEKKQNLNVLTAVASTLPIILNAQPTSNT